MAVQRYDRNGDGQISVKVELLYDFSDSHKEIIWAALDTWERLTNVDFSTHPLDPDETMSMDVPSLGLIGSYWGLAWEWGLIEYSSDIIGRISDAYFSTLVLHEVGHILGLSHQASNSIMTPNIYNAATAPTTKDIANLTSIYGEATDDTVAVVQAGGTGAQEIVGNAGPDILYGNQGMDTLSARDGDDTLYGGQDADRLVAGNGADILYGNLASDLLIGGDGNDTLFGGQGADTLSGGTGDDILSGGLGGDLFVTAGGHDTISDFSGADGDVLSGSVTAWSAQDGASVAWFADGSSVTLIGVNAEDVVFALV
ncbi:MAG: matrixin family metalloprotease [Thalassobaculaceae bacterium]|nr:matrixin family metalloprotease [Thalassobaculaceae bacterium]